jgi:DNA-binding HxlR family transcriptional regulator
MTKIKASSTIQENKLAAYQLCPVTYMMEKISGYWKPIILYQLLSGSKRYSELKKAIPSITEKMLIQHLKQLESDHLLIREARPVVPPHVTYTLSPSGLKLQIVLQAMAAWAIEDSRDKEHILFGKNLPAFPEEKPVPSNAS